MQVCSALYKLALLIITLLLLFAAGPSTNPASACAVFLLLLDLIFMMTLYVFVKGAPVQRKSLLRVFQISLKEQGTYNLLLKWSSVFD